MSERKGYAVKLTNAKGEVQWVVTSDDSLRRVWASKAEAYDAASEALGRKNTDEGWDARIVAVYSKPRRTAAEERADVVAYLNLQGSGYERMIERGEHEGAAKK